MHIPVNLLLRGEDVRLSPAAAKNVFHAVREAGPEAVSRARRRLIEPADVVRNARLTDDQTLRLVYSRYGEAGLFDLLAVTGAQEPRFFEWALNTIVRKSIFIGSDKLQDNVLVPDNHRLPQGPEIGRYNTNVLLPWLSHELYLPGVNHGFLVCGMGGSRILVSHPFFNAGNESYPILDYAPKIDAHLSALGVNGATLYFDLMPGLDYQVAGDDAWLAWFSLVATQSDAVLFIERTSTGLTAAQRREARVVSDRVPKKIIGMTDEQLGHVGEIEEELEVLYLGDPGAGFMTKERADEIESGPTRGYLRDYVDRAAHRTDRLHVVDQAGRATRYPLDHPAYGHLPMITDTDAQFGPPEIPPELDFLKDLLNLFK